MALVVNTNIASMNAQRSLAANTNDMKTAMERLSTGKAINSAADDAAGFAIAETMTAQMRGLSMAAKNSSDALGLLKVIENATNDVTEMLQRIRELAVQANSGTNSVGDIANLQKEAEALMKEIGRVSTDTTYNNKTYLGPDAADAGGGYGFLLAQVGYNDGDTIRINVYDIQTNNLGYPSRTGPGGDISGELEIAVGGIGDGRVIYFHGSEDNTLSWGTVADGTKEYLSITQQQDVAADQRGALQIINDAITQVASYKAEWGALQNRLEYTVSNLMNVVEFTSAARSRIQDADFAVEAANLSKAQVLQQTGTAMLAQANAAPQLALQLLK